MSGRSGWPEGGEMVCGERREERRGNGNEHGMDAHKKKPLPKGAAENQDAAAVLGIGGLEHFLHHGQGGRGAGFQAAEPAHGQHEHIELEGHFCHAVVNDAIVAAH